MRNLVLHHGINGYSADLSSANGYRKDTTRANVRKPLHQGALDVRKRRFFKVKGVPKDVTTYSVAPKG